MIHLGGAPTTFWWGGQVTEIWWGGTKVWSKARTVVATASSLSGNWNDVSGDTEIVTIDRIYLTFSVPVTCDMPVSRGASTIWEGDPIPAGTAINTRTGNRGIPHTFTEII